MLLAARTLLRQIGFVCALLVALTTATLAVEAQACAPGAEAAVSASLTAAVTAVQTDPCASQECADCGLACAHGCCHAQHVGVVEIAASPLTPASFKSPAGWPAVLGALHGAPSGLERPPRA